jgi:hypothetical protein
MMQATNVPMRWTVDQELGWEGEAWRNMPMHMCLVFGLVDKARKADPSIPWQSRSVAMGWVINMGGQPASTGFRYKI